MSRLTRTTERTRIIAEMETAIAALAINAGRLAECLTLLDGEDTLTPDLMTTLYGLSTPAHDGAYEEGRQLVRDTLDRVRTFCPGR